MSDGARPGQGTAEKPSAVGKRVRDVKASGSPNQRRASLAGGVYNYTETLKEKQVT